MNGLILGSTCPTARCRVASTQSRRNSWRATCTEPQNLKNFSPICLTPRVCRLKAYNRNLKVMKRIKFFLKVGLVKPCAVTSASKRLCRLQSVELFREYSMYFQMHCAIIPVKYSNCPLFPGICSSGTILKISTNKYQHFIFLFKEKCSQQMFL